MSDFRGYNSRTDPARNKAAYLSGGQPGYPGDVAAYNNWLYTPMDRRPSPAGYDVSAQSRLASAPGTHSGGTVTPGSYVTPYGTASISNPTFPAYGGAPIAGAAGPSGSVGISAPSGNPDGPQTPFVSALDTAPKATMGVPSPPQNAMQRWQSQSSPQSSNMPAISPQKRYFWATGSIDAHATAADPTQNRGAVAPVQFVNSPSNWAPF